MNAFVLSKMFGPKNSFLAKFPRCYRRIFYNNPRKSTSQVINEHVSNGAYEF